MGSCPPPAWSVVLADRGVVFPVLGGGEVAAEVVVAPPGGELTVAWSDLPPPPQPTSVAPASAIAIAPGIPGFISGLDLPITKASSDRHEAATMDIAAHIPTRRPVEYDAVRRRLWLCGQRCHHGATGAVLAALAVSGLAASQHRPRGLGTAVAAGSLLMVHDWKDRALWFERGAGSQP
jgi:hypothetical protein